MKVGTELQFEFPDECPEGCIYQSEPFSQGSMCTRCPVFCCTDYNTDKNSPIHGPLIDPNGYRDDWAEEWEEFFKTGKEPILMLHNSMSMLKEIEDDLNERLSQQPNSMAASPDEVRIAWLVGEVHMLMDKVKTLKEKLKNEH